MTEVLNDVAKPSWWITVVIAGLIVNLLAAYAKPPLDRIAEKLSTRRREKNQARQRAFDQMVTQVLNDSEERAHLRIRRIEARVHELGWLMWALILLFHGMRLTSDWYYVFATLMIVFAIASANEANRLGSILDTAHRRRHTHSNTDSNKL